MEEKKNHGGKLLTYGIIFLSLFVLYGLCHQKVRISSDTTTIIPMSEDFLNGNILLKGWVLGTNNFYFTEIIPYAIGILLGFSHAALINWIPGIAWAFIAVASLELLDIDFKDRRRSSVFAVLFAAVLLIVPLCAGYTVLNANTHNNLYAFLALYLLWLKKYLRSESRKRLLAMTILAGLLSFSESVTNMVLIAPVALLALFDIHFRKKNGRIWLLGSSIASYVIGKIVFLFFRLTGSMETVGFPIGMAPLSLIPDRVLAWVNQLGVLLGEDWLLSGTVDFNIVFTTAFIAVYVIFMVVQFFRMKKMSDMEACLYLIAAVNAAACIFTDVPVYHRYCVPMYYFGILLMLEMTASAVSHVASRTLYAVCLAAASLLGIYTAAHKTVEYIRAEDYGGTQVKLAQFLENEGLEHGYADFWCASQISFYTDYDVDIFPIWVTADNSKLIPYTELIHHDWYGMSDFHFVISFADENESIFVSEPKLYEICGEPDRTETIGEYKVFIWNEDISRWMGNGISDGRLKPEELMTNEMGFIMPEGIVLEPAGISYGPYCHADAGSYRVTFSGKNLDVLGFDVYADTVTFGTSLQAMDDETLEYIVSFANDIENVEFRLFNNSQEQALIFGATVEPAA